jgi:hypothetical protein
MVEPVTAKRFPAALTADQMRPRDLALAVGPTRAADAG